MIGISTNEKNFIIGIKESKLYSIMADEFTASNGEIASMGICCVNSKKDIHVFIEFLMAKE